MDSIYYEKQVKILNSLWCRTCSEKICEVLKFYENEAIATINEVSKQLNPNEGYFGSYWFNGIFKQDEFKK